MLQSPEPESCVICTSSINSCIYQHSAIVLVNQDIYSKSATVNVSVYDKGYCNQVRVKLLVCKVWLSKGGHAILIFKFWGGGGGGGGGRSNPAWKPNL